MSRPGRGYSWPPFTPGNEASVRHGARSERKVEPLAAEFAEALLEMRPDLEPYPVAVQAWARAEARCELFARWIAEKGLIGPDGEPLAGLNWVTQFERQAADLRARLGLDPRSHAELERGRVEATRGAVDLESIRARGRASLARRADEIEAPPVPETTENDSGVVPSADGAARPPTGRRARESGQDA